MTDFDQEYLNALLRQDLSAFIAKSFVTAVNEPFLDNWHIRMIAWNLEQVAAGKIKRLIINIPPRYSKSQCVSVAFVAWMLGHFPNKKILCGSYNMELAKKFSTDCLKVMQSPWYKKAFPKTHLNPYKSNQTKFETTKGGFRQSISTEGGVTGHGGSLIILDDPMSVQQAYSATERKRVQDFYDKTLYSRLDDKINGAIVVVMQRLHIDDLVAHLLEKDDWTVLSLSALSTKEETYYWGKEKLTRPAGRPLDEKREPVAALEKVRKLIGSIDFQAQYQQDPTYDGQSFVQWEWFNTYDPVTEIIPTFEWIIQSWDTASKIGENNDYSVCTRWGISGDKSYLLDVIRVKLEFPHLKKLIHAEAQKADAVYMEDASSGTGLIQLLHSEGLFVLHGSPKGDKLGRLIGQTGTLEDGLVYVPKNASWLAAFRNEVCQFPLGTNDDQVDSLTQFLAGRARIIKQLKINPNVRKHLGKSKLPGFHALG